MQLITKADLKLLSHKDQVRFAIFCVKQVEGQWKAIPACVKATATVELWLEGKATAEECRSAADAAYAAAKEKTIAEQWNYFYTLLGELGKILYF